MSLSEWIQRPGTVKLISMNVIPVNMVQHVYHNPANIHATVFLVIVETNVRCRLLNVRQIHAERIEEDASTR